MTNPLSEINLRFSPHNDREALLDAFVQRTMTISLKPAKHTAIKRNLNSPEQKTISSLANDENIIIDSFGAKFQTTIVACFFFNKLWLGKKNIYKIEILNVRQRRFRWYGSLWTVSSGSMLFAKTCYHRLWQWKSQCLELFQEMRVLFRTSKTGTSLNVRQRRFSWDGWLLFAKAYTIACGSESFCLCWGFTAQSTKWGHVERGQFT